MNPYVAFCSPLLPPDMHGWVCRHIYSFFTIIKLFISFEANLWCKSRVWIKHNYFVGVGFWNISVCLKGSLCIEGFIVGQEKESTWPIYWPSDLGCDPRGESATWRTLTTRTTLTCSPSSPSCCPTTPRWGPHSARPWGTSSSCRTSGTRAPRRSLDLTPPRTVDDHTASAGDGVGSSAVSPPLSSFPPPPPQPRDPTTTTTTLTRVIPRSTPVSAALLTGILHTRITTPTNAVDITTTTTAAIISIMLRLMCTITTVLTTTSVCIMISGSPPPKGTLATNRST